MAKSPPGPPSRMRWLLVRAFSPVPLARVIFILMVTAVGYYLRPDQNQGLLLSSQNTLFTLAAFAVALIVVTYEYATNIISSKNILLAACGLLFGLIIAYFFHPVIPRQLLMNQDPSLAHTACAVVFGYFGIILAIKHAERFQLSNLRYVLSAPQGPPLILDTSAIIDGRILDLLKMNFIRGAILTPQFVLTELQGIADTSDATKRAKGRRGLEVLEEIRNTQPDLRIIPRDYPEIEGVDGKLVEMAKEFSARLVTNDYNLEKVASLQRVEVLNINELANALRPTVYVGHVVPLEIVREGKEPHQGVGYLEDGTMVVVDDGQAYVGRQTDVTISSILQTTGGRMVFARPRRADSAGKSANGAA